MSDREKVLELVESIIVHAEDERTNRSWESDDIGWKNIDKILDCSQQLKELLKEQEAKVMSLNEALRLKKSDEIWVEYTGCHNRLFMLTVGRVMRYGLIFFKHLPCPWDKYGKSPEMDTDWGWRIWTSKPTEEQRRSVKWE